MKHEESQKTRQKLSFLHNHYIPRKLFCDDLDVSSVIVPEFYPDLNNTYIGNMCYFDSLENYFDYMETKQPYPCKITYSIENINILKNISQLNHLMRRGLRIVQLYHTKSNRFFSCNEGLTNEGLALLKKIEELDMILDLSHIPEKLLRPVINYFSGRMIISHCACSDLYIDKIPRANSLSMKTIESISKYGIIFGVAFLNDIVSAQAAPCNINTEELFLNIVEQIKMFASVVGIDHVALGPDYLDTLYFSQRWNVKLLFPEILLNEEGFKCLYKELSTRSLDSTDIDKLFYLNTESLLGFF